MGTNVSMRTRGKTAGLTLRGDDTVVLSGVTINTTGQKADLRVNGDRVDLRGGTIDTDGKNAGITVDATGGPARLNGSTLSTDGQKADIHIEGNGVGLENSTITTTGKNARITVMGGSRTVHLGNATITTTGQKASISVEGDLIDGGESATVEASGSKGETARVPRPTVGGGEARALGCIPVFKYRDALL